MLKTVLRFICGTFKVKLSGNTVCFLNRINKNNFKIFSLEKNDCQSITFCIYRINYKKIEKLAAQMFLKAEIVETYGLAHLLRNYKKRYGFFVGGAVFAIFLYLSSLFIWNVEISGCQKTTKPEILNLLEKSGFSVGKLKSSLNVKRIENKFLLSTDKISWIAVNIKGTSAYIELREVDKPPTLYDASEPCSIYASRDGVIASVNTYMGYSLVSVGDTVTAGDLMITGNYTDKYGEQYKLHSYAKVMAYTEHSHSVTIPLKTVEHIKTGRTKNKYSIKLIRFNIPLYFNKKIIYNTYDKTTSETKLRIGKNLVLPISIIKTSYTETEKNEVIKSEQTAIMDAYEKLYDFEYNLVGITVNNRRYEKNIDENAVTVKVILDCYEQIGVTGKLD